MLLKKISEALLASLIPPHFPSLRLPCNFSNASLLAASLLIATVTEGPMVAQTAALANNIPSKACRWHPGHYVRCGGENKPTSINAAFFEGRSNNVFRGIQKTYTWKALEPAPGQYDFSLIKSDLADLRKRNKMLIVEIFTKNFHYNADVRGFNDNQPAFLVGSPRPGGGNFQAVYTHGKTRGPAYWDPAVGKRLRNFYQALGEALTNDPNVAALEAVNADETATSIGKMTSEDFLKQNVMPYNRENYGHNLMLAFRALNNSLPHTITIQFVNYPTDLVPYFVETTKSLGGGLGGPDLDPDLTLRKQPPLPTIPYFKMAAGQVPLGMAVQWGDTFKYGIKHEKGSTPDDDIEDVKRTLKFAQEIKLNYIYWQGSFGPYRRLVEEVLSDSDIVDQKDPSRGLAKSFPQSVTPFIK